MRSKLGNPEKIRWLREAIRNKLTVGYSCAWLNLVISHTVKMIGSDWIILISILSFVVALTSFFLYCCFKEENVDNLYQPRNHSYTPASSNLSQLYTSQNIYYKGKFIHTAQVIEGFYHDKNRCDICKTYIILENIGSRPENVSCSSNRYVAQTTREPPLSLTDTCSAGNEDPFKEQTSNNRSIPQTIAYSRDTLSTQVGHENRFEEISPAHQTPTSNSSSTLVASPHSSTSEITINPVKNLKQSKKSQNDGKDVREVSGFYNPAAKQIQGNEFVFQAIQAKNIIRKDTAVKSVKSSVFSGSTIKNGSSVISPSLFSDKPSIVNKNQETNGPKIQNPYAQNRQNSQLKHKQDDLTIQVQKTINLRKTRSKAFNVVQLYQLDSKITKKNNIDRFVRTRFNKKNTIFFTDGSCINHKAAGSIVRILSANQKAYDPYSTKLAGNSSTAGEQSAILLALKLILGQLNEKLSSIGAEESRIFYSNDISKGSIYFILTDHLNTIQILEDQKLKKKDIPADKKWVKDIYNILANHPNIILKYCKAHVNILGNETADQQAKKALRKQITVRNKKVEKVRAESVLSLTKVTKKRAPRRRRNRKKKNAN